MSDPTPYDDDSLLPGGPATDEHDPVEERPARAAGSRRAAKKRRRPLGCLFGVVAALAVMSVVLYLGARWLAGAMGGGESTEDYAGGTPIEQCATDGEVEVTIAEGDSLRAMGEKLADQDVVATAGAFVSAADANEAATSIQVGVRRMCTQMAASEAVELLTQTNYIGIGGVTIPEGLRVDQIVERVSEATSVPAEDLQTVLDDPAQLEQLGLPASADGNPEGYLYPARYDFGAEPSPEKIIGDMIGQWNSVAESVGFTDDAVPGFDQHELLTIASIIEREVMRDEDRPAVAEVIYDRLDGTCVGAGIPQGLLQMDSTIHYLSGGGTGSVFTDSEARESDSPYNTYRISGLPPTPIASPGRASMEAAIAPTSEEWCYFVAVDLASGETSFATDEAGHEANREQLREWCRNNEHSGCS